MEGNLFSVFAIILALAALFGVVATKFKQPLVIAFIVVGVIVGPAFADIATGADYVGLISEVAISILLFTVGLKLDADELRNTGRTAVIVGIVQMVAIAVFGFIAARVIGMPVMDSVYVATAVTFSSTIVVIKMLSDRDELDSLHGRIAVGVLIVQDIAVIITMLFITAFGGVGGGSTVAFEVGKSFGLGAIFTVGVLLIGRFILPRLMRKVATSSELLVLFAIAWAVALAAAGDALGFGKELGAFIAGLSLASSPFRETVLARLTPLRDFLLVFFFMNLGMQLDFNGIGSLLLPAIVLSVFVTVGTPIVVTWTMGRLGYHRMTGFFTGLSLSQISEFSLIMATLGVTLGQIANETLSLITLVTIITIISSTYLMRYAGRLYRMFERQLRVFQSTVLSHEDMAVTVGDETEIIIFGMSRYGAKIAAGLAAVGVSVLGVDFDPRITTCKQGDLIYYRYGDIEDPELLSYLPLCTAKCVISTLQKRDSNITLLRSLDEYGYEGRIVVTAVTDDDARELKGLGADKVLRPADDAADQAIDILLEGSGIREWDTPTLTGPIVIPPGYQELLAEEISDDW